MKIVTSLVVWLALLGVAHADPRLEATALFEQGAKDLSAGRTEQACKELASSLAMFDDSGTRGVLAAVAEVQPATQPGAPAPTPAAGPVYTRWWFWLGVAAGAVIGFEVVNSLSSSSSSNQRTTMGGAARVEPPAGFTLLRW